MHGGGRSGSISPTLTRECIHDKRCRKIDERDKLSDSVIPTTLFDYDAAAI